MMIDCRGDSYIYALIDYVKDDFFGKKETHHEDKKEVCINININLSCNGKKLINPARFK